MLIKSERREPDISGMSSHRVLAGVRRALTGRRARPVVVLPDDAPPRPAAARSTSPSYVNLIAPLPAPAPRRPVELEGAS